MLYQSDLLLYICSFVGKQGLEVSNTIFVYRFLRTGWGRESTIKENSRMVRMKEEIYNRVFTISVYMRNFETRKFGKREVGNRLSSPLSLTFYFDIYFLRLLSYNSFGHCIYVK